MSFKETIEAMTIEEVAEKVILCFNDNKITGRYAAFNKAFGVQSEDFQTIDHDIIDETIEMLVFLGYAKKEDGSGFDWYRLTEKGKEVKQAGSFKHYLELEKQRRENYNKPSVTNNNFNVEGNGHSISEVVIGGNQSSLKISRNLVTESTINNNPIKPTKRSVLEICSWVVGIIVGALAIYEFVIKKLIH